MHGADGGAGHSAAHHGAQTSQRQREAGGTHQSGDEHRQDGQGGIIGNRKAGAERQHGHEMRGPDAASGDQAGGGQPARAHVIMGGAGTRHQTHRGTTREKTQDARKHNKTQIMLLGYAAQHIQHGRHYGRRR
jgi:hypothetical protein